MALNDQQNNPPLNTGVPTLGFAITISPDPSSLAALAGLFSNGGQSGGNTPPPPNNPQFPPTNTATNGPPTGTQCNYIPQSFRTPGTTILNVVNADDHSQVLETITIPDGSLGQNLLAHGAEHGAVSFTIPRNGQELFYQTESYQKRVINGIPVDVQFVNADWAGSAGETVFGPVYTWTVVQIPNLTSVPG